VKKGDTLGVVAPSSPFDKEAFYKGLSLIKSMGFQVRVPDEIWEQEAYLAGSDETRAMVFNRMFSDPDIKAVVCARGGYGALRMLKHVDFEKIRNAPKPLIGFSDVTVLLTVLNRRCGLIPYHGPMVCSIGQSDEASVRGFERILCDGPSGTLEARQGRIISGGRADGILYGGNLASLCHLLGTEYEPDFRDGILMIEDVGEAPYRLDRMLTQMKYAGLFDGLRAVVGGTFERCGDARQVEDIFRNTFVEFGIPVVMDFPFGHGTENQPFPVGVHAELDADLLKVTY
jgi:muramoyltetrapeptide carboxypeptidase